MTMTATRLLVNRKDFAQSRLEDFTPPALADGEVLVKTGAFGLTANNITYALSGDMIGYWKFYPVEDGDWGIVPVWGFAEVVESRCADLPVGSGFWGFLPMASHAVMRPAAIRAGSFTDGAAHRQPLPELYNRYQRTDTDPPELTAAADARSVLFPLLFTGYVLADYLEDNAFFGAEQVIIASASSKTAMGTAHYVRELATRPVTLRGVTSGGNIGFVEGTGLYDRVIGYDAIADLSPDTPTVLVDMSGNGEVIAALHHHFGEAMRASIGVGATHWDAPRNRAPLPGVAPSFFFAPAQVLKREADWGPGEIIRRIADANLMALPKLQSLIAIDHHHGGDAVQNRYAAMAAGEVPPASALILSF
jgi:hypothetical protein